MSKYALSFTTQGNDLNTYYLAASVLGMVSSKYGSSSIYLTSSSGFNNATYAKTFQGYIDDIFKSKYWQTSVTAYPVGKVYAQACFTNSPTKTATSVTVSSTTVSSSSSPLTGIRSWLIGSSGYSQWSAAITQSVPYINYKISSMSETDFREFVNAVISAGGLSDFEQTNAPVQA